MFIQPLAILERHSSSPLHLSKPYWVDLPDQRRSNSGGHSRGELGAKSGGEAEVPRTHHDPMKRILSLNSNCLHSLHDI